MSDLIRFTDTPEGYFHKALELIDNSIPRSDEEQIMLVHQAGELIARGILPQVAVIEDEDTLFKPELHKFEGYQTRVNPAAYKGEGLSVESTLTLFTKSVSDDGYPTDPEDLIVGLDAYKGILEGPEITEPKIILDGYTVVGGWVEPGSVVSGRIAERPHFHASFTCNLIDDRPRASWEFRENDETSGFDMVPDLNVMRQFAYHLSKSSVVSPTIK